jgi:predicted HTH transcriptional regulator
MTARHLSGPDLLGLGESQVLEFKRSGSLLKEAFADLCGMVNAASSRGTVVFGVEPTGHVCGLGETNLDSFQQTLSGHAGQKLEPPMPIEIESAYCDEKPIVLLRALRNRAVPYHEYGGRAYIREGSVTRQLTLLEKQRLATSRNRDLHNGPWICDRCGAFAGSISSIEITASGARKAYKHRCGGEWWPAT